uniref:Uncharacterized protein n=1 Tax=Anguilla anguilla TaxID=7936 RepID=A0A0E9T869_ANGAN
MQFTVGAFRHSEVSILDYKFITEKEPFQRQYTLCSYVRILLIP